MNGNAADDSTASSDMRLTARLRTASEAMPDSSEITVETGAPTGGYAAPQQWVDCRHNHMCPRADAGDGAAWSA